MVTYFITIFSESDNYMPALLIQIPRLIGVCKNNLFKLKKKDKWYYNSKFNLLQLSELNTV